MVDNRYRVNAGSVFSLQYHLVWCPKYRKRILVNALAKRLRELLYQKAKEIKAAIHALQIMPDHVHRFVESDPAMAPARLAAQFKGFTTTRFATPEELAAVSRARDILRRGRNQS